MPFTKADFFEVIHSYNLAVGLGLALLYAAAAISLVMLYGKKKSASPVGLFVLSFFWAWMGVVYHWMFFSTINPLAKMFGAVFVIEALFLAFAASKKWTVELAAPATRVGAFQVFCFAFSLLIYPALGFAFGHGYPNGPAFGLPCPTTIFTLGILSGVRKSRREILFLAAIPLVWAVFATSAAKLFDVYQDYALALTAVVFVIGIYLKTFTQALPQVHQRRGIL